MNELGQMQNSGQEVVALYNRFQSSAKWFYWIAGLSIINTIINFFDGNVSFIVGLGITQIVDGLVAAFEAPPIVKFIALCIDIMISGIFIILGYFALRRAKWAFIIGMILYVLDGLLFLLVMDILSIAFHVFVLYSLFVGIKCLKEIKEIEGTQEQRGF